ncbi:MAG: hypothetical protein PWP76_774 [Candidatus Diapherotrites archaeon]|nr:hypothetical protein [Candidatus Diapherotrites archaeon]MDN5366833.1 hypothetical protein [Candidatus Diapherotrites archaeon]
MGESITVDEIRQVVREVVRDELTKLYLALTPEVSEEEMREIRKLLREKDEGKEETEGLSWLGE